MDFYNHPNAHDLKTEAEKLRKQNFNTIHVDVVGDYLSGEKRHIIDQIQPYSMKEHVERGLVDVEEYVLQETQEGYDLQDKAREGALTDEAYRSQLDDICVDVTSNLDNYDYIEEYADIAYPEIVFNWVYEAADKGLSRLLMNKREEIEQAAGLHMIEGYGVLNNMLFVSGVGYNFTYEHWLPLFTEVFDWIDDDLLETNENETDEDQ